MRNRLGAPLLVLFILPAAIAACGGGDASDEEFVADLCSASAQLRTDLAAAIKASSAESESAKAVERLIPPIEAFVKAFDDADPPKDLKEWHDEASAELNDSLATFKSEKKLAALRGFGDNPVPPPPPVANDRLTKVAAGVEACNGETLFGPG